MAHKAGDTVTIKINHTARADRNATVLSTDRDGTLEVAFSDGSTTFYDANEIEDQPTRPEDAPFVAALTEANARWTLAQENRLQHAGLSKQADARGDEANRTYHWRQATRCQNEMIMYSDAIKALSKIVGK